MQITEITVTAGRTFNHPHEDYSNLKPVVTLRATISPGEDSEKCIKDLQAKAEGLVEDHKRQLLSSLEELYQLGQRQSQVRGLTRQLTDAQRQLDEIRKQHPDLAIADAGEAAQTAKNDEIF